jgi:hypothetical protein
MKPKRDNSLIQRVSESLNGPDYKALHRHETAIHESSHVVVALLCGETVEGVSLGTSGIGGGAVFMRPRSRDVHGLRRYMTIIAAGNVLDSQSLPSVGTGELDEDQNRLRDLATEILGKAAKPARIQNEIARARKKAARLVKRHNAAIEELAQALIHVYEVIDGVKSE